MSIEIKSELVPFCKAQRFREGGRLHKNVRIYLQSKDEDRFNQIASVEYELHPTFKDRCRTSTNRIKKF
jgi:transcription initiation factor IIF auxiliary subunit